MISLILPYWERRVAADAAIDLLARQYAGVDMEVIIVDDGNPIPFVAPKSPINIKVVRLPEKNVPKSPATAWNAGVAASCGDLIALSCIEILHKAPVLEQMAEHVEHLGEDGYVLAAAWCPDRREWHCHSTVAVPDCPRGTGIAFLGMMHRELFDRVGGFDEGYRDGAGYEDRDLIRKLCVAGAEFVIRDDLVVTHPKTGATIHWPPEGFARNAELFRSKWGACT